MRRRLTSLPAPVLAGALLFVAAFALYSATTQPLTGYEPETGAVTEGLVLEGHLWDDESSSLPMKADIPGKGGHHYARTGLLQPLVEAPFFAAGHLADETVGHFSGYPNGWTFLWFYNPFAAAVAALAIFALVLQTRRSLAWATAIAALFAVASLAWPYSKIGMETTFMAAVAVAYAVAVWARRSPSALSWSLAGFATGAAVATKAYALVSVLPIAVLLGPTLLRMERRRQLRLAAAACLPVLLWLAAIGFYNWSRFGSPTDFGYAEAPLTRTLPVGMLGLLLSPGKGLVFYSPLVVLGALGLPRLWRADRGLALALLAGLGSLTFLGALSTYWGDEVWGPRYIVPMAWTLLVPIAWWADGPARRRALAVVAALAVVVQAIGISAAYSQYIDVARGLTGVPLYRDREAISPQEIPYGNDPTRWIPELSAIVVQAEGLVSSQVVEPLTGEGLTVTYAPFEGRSRTVNLSEAPYRMPLDFWWSAAPRHRAAAVAVAVAMALLAAAAATALYLLSFGRRRRFPAAPATR